MSLSAYNKKRKFGSTHEPRGRKKSKTKKDPLIFVIHEHHARRLHYDLRLELDGVLKSWAVPKGPPLTPEDKRLAVEVEDHPFSYATFSGLIPKGNYGAGVVHIWDNGPYSAMLTADRTQSEKILREEYKKGRMHILLAGKKLRGLYMLIRTKDKQWLWMIKENSGSKNSAYPPSSIEVKKTKDAMPHKIKPMLAELADEPFDNPNWIFEIKWDGYRAIAETGKQTILYSRTNQDFTKTYESIVKALRSIRHECVIDGEIIALNERGQPEFQLLQEYLEKPVTIAYAVFDLLYIDGEDIREKPLIERKEILKSILTSDMPEDFSRGLIYSEHVDTNGIRFFQEVEKNGGEGIMAKQKDSRYISPKDKSFRSSDWLKIKITKRQEAIICGFTQARGERPYFGALILGVYENKKLTYIGHTGTGFTEESLKDLHEKLRKILLPRSPFENTPETNMPATWVKPILVCEIKFTEWTKDGHIRHPVFLGLRQDKPANTVVKEKVKDSIAEQVPITNPDKVLWPEEGYTKNDLVNYYRKIAPIILPYLKDRPESLLRHPNGINEKGFFQKNIEEKNLPSFIETIAIPSEHASNQKGTINYLLCQNEATLIYLANLACIELNPWNSKKGSLERPDIMIIDLDPVERPFSDVVKVAKEAKKVLDIACESSFCKTSGKRGIHIVIPLKPDYTYDTIRTFSHLLVQLIHARIPEITSLERSPSKRNKMIYLDWLQNRKGQTLAAPYSLRPTKEATVSTPIEWKELNNKLDPKKFTINTIFKRLDKKGDIWATLFRNPIYLAESIERLKKELIKNNDKKDTKK